MYRKIISASFILLAGLFFLKDEWYPLIADKHTPVLPAPAENDTIISLLSAESKKGVSGTEYMFIYKNKAHIGFEVTRPDKKDTSVYLCIAGAFTTLDSFAIDGLYMYQGKIGNQNKINKTLGGIMEIENGECAIFPAQEHKVFTETYLSGAVKRKVSLFQQIQCIANGTPAHFKDVQLFQRRGVVIMKDGRTAVVESNKMITLAAFSNDLAALDVRELLYTDMGFWDEGWYKTSGSIHTMGHYLSQTDKQSNWVVFRK